MDTPCAVVLEEQRGDVAHHLEGDGGIHYVFPQAASFIQGALRAEAAHAHRFVLGGGPNDVQRRRGAREAALRNKEGVVLPGVSLAEMGVIIPAGHVDIRAQQVNGGSRFLPDIQHPRC